eukprot:6460628-Prymnesium_polylepis.1
MASRRTRRRSTHGGPRPVIERRAQLLVVDLGFGAQAGSTVGAHLPRDRQRLPLGVAVHAGTVGTADDLAKVARRADGIVEAAHDGCDLVVARLVVVPAPGVPLFAIAGFPAVWWSHVVHREARIDLPMHPLRAVRRWRRHAPPFPCGAVRA